MLQTHILPGGLTVLVEELPYTHSVSIGCFVGVGSGHEDAALAGISHFIEHMLFKGSRAYPTPKRISDAIEGVGGMIDAYTELESTVFYAKVADPYAERAVAVLGDMLTHPLFDPRDIEKERRVITEELRQTADTPSELVHLLLDAAMWGDQPFGRDIAGDEASIAGLTAGQIMAHWRHYYTRANTIISIAGNISAERAVELVTDALRDLPEGTPAVCLPTAPALRGPTLSLTPDESEQCNFCLGFPGVSKADPDRRAMLVFDTVLGGSMSSRLVQEIREERGLAYSVGSDNHEHHDAGKWTIYGSVEPGNLVECLHAVLSELRRARVEGITKAELTQVQEQVKGGILLSLEDTWSVASRNGAHQLRYGRVIPIEQVVAEVEAVTVADVLRVGRRVLDEDAMHLAVIGPYDDDAAAELRGLLRLAE